MGIGRTGLVAVIGLAPYLSAPASEMPDLSILVNSQGLAQQDLSIRGSSYTGAGISVNGLNLKVPYSAHFNADLPLPPALYTAGTAQYASGHVSGHLAGTAAYTTAPQSDSLAAEAAIGTREHYMASLVGGHAGVGGFLGWEKAQAVDYDTNDYDRYGGGAYLQHASEEWRFDLIGAGQKKEFGAQGYYGIPADQYAFQQTEDALIFLGAARGELDGAFIRASTAWRQFDDLYQTTGLTRDVQSRFGALAVEGRTLEVQHLSLNLRGDIEYEGIDGTTGEHDRTRGSILLLPEARFERFSFKAGLNSVFASSESPEYLPAAGITWLANDNTRVYADYSETVQQPDYQTLESNALLRQQKSQNTELGLKQFLSADMDWRAGLFHRRLEHASDWVGGAAVDLGSLNVSGADTMLRYYPSGDLVLQAFYQWVYKDNRRQDGFYELDYPEHLLNLSAYWGFLNEFALEFIQTTRYQTDNIARTSGNFGANAALGLHYLPRFAQNARLSLRVENLWASDFQVLPGLKPRPTSVSTGITVAW